jgi:transcriptional regulator with XRE-family HTH domain
MKNEYNEDDSDVIDSSVKDFSENLKALRKSAGYSQLQLAMKAGLTANFIHDLEHGQKLPSLPTIAKLASALDTKPYMFLLPELPNKGRNDEQSGTIMDYFVRAFEDFQSNYYEGSITKKNNGIIIK